MVLYAHGIWRWGFLFWLDVMPIPTVSFSVFIHTCIQEQRSECLHPILENIALDEVKLRVKIVTGRAAPTLLWSYRLGGIVYLHQLEVLW